MKMAFAEDENCTPATAASIAIFEAEHSISLPSVYREFLATSGGGYPERDLSRFENTGDFIMHVYGLHEGPEWKRLDCAIREFGHDLSQFLPIAISNGGNYFLLRLADPDRGAIYFWDHELEDYNSPKFAAIIRISNDFGEWMDSLEECKREAG